MVILELPQQSLNDETCDTPLPLQVCGATPFSPDLEDQEEDDDEDKAEETSDTSLASTLILTDSEEEEDPEHDNEDEQYEGPSTGTQVKSAYNLTVCWSRLEWIFWPGAGAKKNESGRGLYIT